MQTPDKLQNEIDIAYMKIALEEARLAEAQGEVPIGACVVYDGRVIARDHNRRETDKSPCAHAEFLAMQKAAQVLERWRLTGCTVYVTLEPCLMCAGLMINSRVDRCVYGSFDPKGGALGTLYALQNDERLNHDFEVVSGVMDDQCSSILKEFFSRRRKERKQAKAAGTFSKPQIEEIDELRQARAQINHIDQELFSLLAQRLEASNEVVQYKIEHNLDILDTSREEEKLKWAESLSSDQEIQHLYCEFMQDLMDISKTYQSNIRRK